MAPIDPSSSAVTFEDMGLPEPLCATLHALGYHSPSPIQATAIPPLLEGRDVLGMAQTGTGKTAAFALPLLAQLNVLERQPQILVLAPTRELAIQVAESWQRYGAKLPGIEVCTLYGGASYVPQLRSLDRGAQIVVGTPGRIIDHLNRGTLKLRKLRALVLDEADEMLRMGFFEDVTRIVESCPQQRQTALFSATMPPPIRLLARRHMRDPIEITIQADHSKPLLIRQRAAVVPFRDKTDALLRLLACEETDGVIVFVATRVATTAVAEALQEQGYRAAQLSGEVAQREREITVDRFIKGSIDILVATDVAARGLDVDRVSHVINYDLPSDIESYTHRIGRTGRAGRSGDAVSFASPHQRHLLNTFSRKSSAIIERWSVPSAEDVNRSRLQRFAAKVLQEATRSEGLEAYKAVFQDIVDQGVDPLDLMAAMARMINGTAEPFSDRRQHHPTRSAGKQNSARLAAATQTSKGTGGRRYSMGVGHRHGATPARILAIVAKASGLKGKQIGKIAIGQHDSIVDLPDYLPAAALKSLRKVRMNGHPLLPSEM